VTVDNCAEIAGCRDCRFYIECYKAFCNICNNKQPSVRRCYFVPLKPGQLSDRFIYVLFDTEYVQDLEPCDGYLETCRNRICDQQMCSVCEEIVHSNIICAHVAHVFTYSGRTTQGNILTTAGSAEYSRIRYMLFHIIMVDTIQRFVQKVSGTELDIVYLTAAFELNLCNKINFQHKCTATIRCFKYLWIVIGSSVSNPEYIDYDI